MCSPVVSEIIVRGHKALIELKKLEIDDLGERCSAVRLHTRICAVPADDLVESARLKRNLAHVELRRANLGIKIAEVMVRLTAILAELEANIAPPRVVITDLLSGLLVFGGLGDEFKGTSDRSGLGGFFGGSGSNDSNLFGFQSPRYREEFKHVPMGSVFGGSARAGR